MKIEMLKNTIWRIIRKIDRKYKYLKYKIYSRIPTKGQISPPIFIIGSGSSGTTVLSKILNQHEDVFSVGEADEAWFMADKKTSLRHYKVKGKFYFDESDFNELQTVKLNRIFCRILKKAKKKRLVEKTPHNLYRIKWVKEIFPDAKFINIVRSGKDFIRSVKKRQMFELSPLAYPGWWWRKDDYIWHVYKYDFLKKHPDYRSVISDDLDDENRAAIQWINAMEKDNIKDLSENQCITVKYENLIEDPEKIVRKIYDFTNLKYDKKPIIFAKKQLKRPLYTEGPKLIPEIKKIFNEFCRMHGYDTVK